MTHIARQRVVDHDELAAAQEPIDDVLLEAPATPLGNVDDGAGGDERGADTSADENDARGALRFHLAEGPFDTYERTLSWVRRDDGRYDLSEEFAYRLAIPFWRPLFAVPVRRRLQARPTRGAWWAPADRVDARAASVISYLAILAILSGFLGSLLSQTLSYVGTEFGADSSDQAVTAGLIRLGTPLAFGVMWIADRRGRRLLLLASALIATLLAATAALAPTLWSWALIQAVFRGLSTALGLLIGIIAVEESPPGSRAFTVSVLSLCAGLGSGMVVWAVPLAGLGVGGWRWIYVLTLLGLIPLAAMWRRIPESARFEIAAERDDTSLDAAGRSLLTRRLALLAATAFLFTLFAAPASTLNTDYLKTVHDFSPGQVSLFKLVTSTPIGLGVVVAGWIADRRGRKTVGAVGVALGAVLTTLEYNTAGVSLWVFGIAGTIIGGAVVPTLGVYGPELFGTVRRGRTNGAISIVGVLGSVTGLFIGGWILDRSDYGATFSVLLIGPLIVAGLVLFLFPETANRTLEDINPEDAV